MQPGVDVEAHEHVVQPDVHLRPVDGSPDELEENEDDEEEVEQQESRLTGGNVSVESETSLGEPNRRTPASSSRSLWKRSR